MKKRLLLVTAAVLIASIFCGGTVSAATSCNAKGDHRVDEAVCAGKIVRDGSYTKVNEKCKNGGNKQACLAELKTARIIGCGTTIPTTDEQCVSSYTDKVAEILTTSDHDPCETAYHGGPSAEKQCKGYDGHWQWYYEVKPSDGSGKKDGDKDKKDGNSDSSTSGDDKVASVSEGECATILTGLCNENGITELIYLVIGILTGAIVVAGTIGIIICGVLWMTARDNEAQVMKAKKRILDIVIGIVAWVLLSLLANLFIPKPQTDINKDAGLTTGDAGIESDNKIG